MECVTDAELMAATCGGDDEAFAAIVDRYKDGLVRYVTHLTRDHARAEEVAQETFVKLYVKAARYRDAETLKPLLYKIATNHVRSEATRSKRWSRLLQWFGGGEEGRQESPQVVLLRDEATRHVESAVASLPVVFRSAVVLRDIEGWSYDDIARMLGCNSGTVKSRIARGREILKRELSGYWNGEKSERQRVG
jgi:RNA polymerase sigma-70 factor (ECF subfamily)